MREGEMRGVPRWIVGSIEAGCRHYRTRGEGALAQVAEADLARPPEGSGNSLAVIVWHLAGNLESGFTDFLTTDRDLGQSVTIRGVVEHSAYHGGQAALLRKALRAGKRAGA
jgi:hypothetical protein